MITDEYSRKIVGYTIADNMETESMIGALKIAVEQRNNQSGASIDHSDRELQYCSKEHALVISKNSITLSMTENGYPYENAPAERMNRTHQRRI